MSFAFFAFANALFALRAMSNLPLQSKAIVAFFAKCLRVLAQIQANLSLKAREMLIFWAYYVVFYACKLAALIKRASCAGYHQGIISAKFKRSKP